VTYEALFARRALGIRLDLESVTAIYDRLGRPVAGRAVIHVLGTNGKGSVAAMSAHALGRLGRRVGLYTSPHLQRVTERIRVADQEVEDSEFRSAIALVLEHESAVELVRPLSFFEVLTLAAFVVFERAHVDTLVVEAGLGGRWDATRILQAGTLAFTAIALDHERWLGTTVAAIAEEKAAVIHGRARVVTGLQAEEAMQVLQTNARRVGASFQIAPPLVRTPIGLAGDHQRHNAGIALAAVQTIEPQAQASDLDGVSWSGRLERHPLWGGTVTFDVGHNPHGIAALAAALRNDCGPFVILFGCQADKNVEAMTARLRTLGPIWWVALDPEMEPPRDAALHFANPAEPGLDAAIRDHLEQGGHLVVCGSHQLVGPLRGRWIESNDYADPSDPRGLAPLRG